MKGLTSAEAQQRINVSSCQRSFIVACKTDTYTGCYIEINKFAFLLMVKTVNDYPFFH